MKPIPGTDHRPEKTFPMNPAYQALICLVYLSLLFASTSGFAQQITLAWDPVTSSEIQGYRVYVRLESQAYDFSSPLWQGEETQVVVSHLDSTQKYFFTVRSYTPSGIESGNSNEIYYPLFIYGKRIAVDFGDTGLYQYDGSNWTYIATYNAVDMKGCQGSLITNMTGHGLYRFNGYDWQKFTANDSNPFIGWQTSLVVNYIGKGILLYDNNGISQTLLSINPENLIRVNDGFVADFTGYGLFSYTHSGWKFLSPLHPDNCISWQNGLAVDFGENGLWNFDGQNWVEMDHRDPGQMIAHRSGLAVDFDDDGLFLYDRNEWQRIAYWDSDLIVSWKNGLAVSFKEKGLWNYDGSSWHILKNDFCEAMVAWDNGLAVDFGKNGLWNCSSQNQTWVQLTSYNPENIIDF